MTASHGDAGSTIFAKTAHGRPTEAPAKGWHLRRDATAALAYNASANLDPNLCNFPAPPHPLPSEACVWLLSVSRMRPELHGLRA